MQGCGQHVAGDRRRRQTMATESLRPIQAVIAGANLRHLVAGVAHQAGPGLGDLHACQLRIDGDKIALQQALDVLRGAIKYGNASAP